MSFFTFKKACIHALPFFTLKTACIHALSFFTLKTAFKNILYSRIAFFTLKTVCIHAFTVKFDLKRTNSPVSALNQLSTVAWNFKNYASEQDALVNAVVLNFFWNHLTSFKKPGESFPKESILKNCYVRLFFFFFASRPCLIWGARSS